MWVRIFVVVCLFCEALATANPDSNGSCVLPEVEDVDWNMLPGTWYQIMNSHDAYDDHVNCFTMRNLKSTPEGGYMEDVIYSVESNESFPLSYTPHIMPAHWIDRGNSRFTFDSRYKFLGIDEAVGGGAKGNAMKELDGFFTNPITYVTDYENYVIFMQCDSTDYRNVWVSMRNNRPSAADILRIHNRLIGMGDGWDEVEIYLTGCTKLPKAQNYI
uniref:uncharacterized protein LOC120344789 n=1 Tax=Styela clava TaxID=7725 RepID=UPI001939CC4E|nr:uncharacterized protein LOC120344789 [Styela clava]